MTMMNFRGAGWELLVFGKVAEDLLEKDAPAANTDIPCTSASACGGGGGVAASSHEHQRHNIRPRKKERLNLGNNLSYEILDHHRRGHRLNTLAGEGTSTDTTLQRRNFFNGEGTSSSAGANIGVAAAAKDPASPPPQEMAVDEEGWRSVHRELGGSELVGIGEKTVTNSDRDTHQSRLLLTNDLMAKVYKQVSNKTEKEVDKINSDGGLEVKVIDEAGREYNMRCRYRECHRGMVINGGWNNFLKNHDDDGLQDVAT